jgi:hypothetical protein
MKRVNLLKYDLCIYKISSNKHVLYRGVVAKNVISCILEYYADNRVINNCLPCFKRCYHLTSLGVAHHEKLIFTDFAKKISASCGIQRHIFHAHRSQLLTVYCRVTEAMQH